MKQDTGRTDEQIRLRKKKIISVVIAVIVIALMVGLSFLIGRPLVDTIKHKASFRLWMQQRGFLKYPLMIGLMALQVVVALIPGGPIEIAAGYTFGAWGGTLLCLLGSLLGTVLIILFVRKYGMKLITLFFKKEQIEQVRFFKDPRKLDATVFLLFLLPGTPKDVLTYLAGLVPIHLGKFLLLTTVARLPSILSSTIVGKYVDEREYKLAALVFGITLVLTLVPTLLYRAHQKKTDKSVGAAPENTGIENTDKENDDVSIG